jgi:hypothetical protein
VLPTTLARPRVCPSLLCRYFGRQQRRESTRRAIVVRRIGGLGKNKQKSPPPPIYFLLLLVLGSGSHPLLLFSEILHGGLKRRRWSSFIAGFGTRASPSRGELEYAAM